MKLVALPIFILVSMLLVASQPHGYGYRQGKAQSQGHSQKLCRAADGPWKNVPGQDSWCNDNCNHVPPYCPSSHCTCSKGNSWLPTIKIVCGHTDFSSWAIFDLFPQLQLTKSDFPILLNGFCLRILWFWIFSGKFWVLKFPVLYLHHSVHYFETSIGVSKGFPHPQRDLQVYPGTNLWWSERSWLFFECQWHAQEHTDPFTGHCWPRLWLLITSNKTIYEIIKRKLKPNLHASRRRQEINK